MVNLLRKESNNEQITDSNMTAAYNLIPFQVYQIQIQHPDTWQVFINPGKTFAYYDGFAKIDCSAEKKRIDPASLTLRWAKMKGDIDIDDYMDEVIKQYQKKQRKNRKDHFEITSKDPAPGAPHKAYLLRSMIRANHSVYRALGKEEMICSLQLTTYCPETKRLVIANISSAPDDFEKNDSVYKEILLSLTCH